MRTADAYRFSADINVTPLVDVVLVLLIIFMIVAPQMASRPDVALPTAAGPPHQPDDGRRVVVGLTRGGTIWVDGERVGAKRVQRRLRRIAGEQGDRTVVIEADRRLTFGEVRRAMLAVEAAGFKDVGLIVDSARAASR